MDGISLGSLQLVGDRLDELALPLRSFEQLAEARPQPLRHLAAVGHGFLAQAALQARPLYVGVSEAPARWYRCNHGTGKKRRRTGEEPAPRRREDRRRAGHGTPRSSLAFT